VETQLSGYQGNQDQNDRVKHRDSIREKVLSSGGDEKLAVRLFATGFGRYVFVLGEVIMNKVTFIRVKTRNNDLLASFDGTLSSLVGFVE